MSSRSADIAPNGMRGEKGDRHTRDVARDILYDNVDVVVSLGGSDAEITSEGLANPLDKDGYGIIRKIRAWDNGRVDRRHVDRRRNPGCHGLVPWSLTFAATHALCRSRHYPRCHGLVPWSLTFVATHPFVAALNSWGEQWRSIARIRRGARRRGSRGCSGERNDPRGKPGAFGSGVWRDGPGP